MNIIRKDFIKSLITGLTTTAITPAFGNSTSEFDKCKNDVVYFAEKYSGFKLMDAHRKYLKNISDHKVFLCAKARQSGITTMNAVYAYWKANFFERQYVKYLSIKSIMSSEILNIIDDIDVRVKSAGLSHYRKHGAFDNSSFIGMNTYYSIVDSRINRSTVHSIYDEETYILDDMAFTDVDSGKLSDFIQDIHNENLQGKMNSRFIISSTPSSKDHLFATFWNSTPDENRIKITWKDCSYPKSKDELMKIVGEKRFSNEFECEFI